MKKTLLVLVAALAAAAAASAAADGGGGPSPGALVGWDGVRAPGGAVRYVALPAGEWTNVAAVRVRDGRIIRWTSVRGLFGVPAVAFDGTADGLSADRKTLVLTSLNQQTGPTTFLTLRASRLDHRREIVLPGVWSFDAISPDGATIYGIQYLKVAGEHSGEYRVRAIDVATRRPRPGAIVDRREPGERMNGAPIARSWNRARNWAYTLYSRPAGTAFIHALDTRRGKAVCIDLPWNDVQSAIWGTRIAVSRDGSTLTLRQRPVGTLATVDLRNFEVRALRRPVAPS